MNNNKTKLFIKNFNFPNPDWNEVLSIFPQFPDVPSNDLTQEEKHILGAIKFIWYANHGGRPILIKRTITAGALVIIIIVSSTLISRYSPISPSTVVKQVSAATVSASLKAFNTINPQNTITGATNILESTVSAMLK